MFETLRVDIRHGARTCRQAPLLVAAVALTLSLGVGVSSVLLTLFDGLFLQPNVGHDPDSFVRLFVAVDGGDDRTVRGEPTLPPSRPDDGERSSPCAWRWGRLAVA